jgi:hypothetical protein
MRGVIFVFTALVAAGCSIGGPLAIAPKPASQQSLARIYTCPAKGSIVYVSDYNNDVINVYKGNLAGQAPCGQIGSHATLSAPDGLFVQVKTHDLYVANRGVTSVKVFHRGQLVPYNTYIDQSYQLVQLMDATVAKDGTLIATSIDCTLSTWIVGPNGGTFVGNFMMKHCQPSYPTYVAADKSDTIYYDGQVGGMFNPHAALFSVSCPLGACGAQTRFLWDVPTFSYPTGMAFDAAGDLLVTNGQGDTFELPNPKPKFFHMAIPGDGMAINVGDDHWFVAADTMGAAEYSYPDGALIGTVPANLNGYMAGVAVDP